VDCANQLKADFSWIVDLFDKRVFLFSFAMLLFNVAVTGSECGRMISK